MDRAAAAARGRNPREPGASVSKHGFNWLVKHMIDVSQCFRATESGEIERVRELVDAEPDLVRARDLEGATALHHAALVKRPETRLATGMSEEAVGGFLAALASAAEAVEVSFRWRPQLSDPTDELVMEAAVNGEADALVTHNPRDFEPATRLFGLRVLLPRDVLKEL